MECQVYSYLNATEGELGLFLVLCAKLELSFMGEPAVSRAAGLAEAVPVGFVLFEFAQLHVQMQRRIRDNGAVDRLVKYFQGFTEDK